jgi:hypothetical protein
MNPQEDWIAQFEADENAIHELRTNAVPASLKMLQSLIFIKGRLFIVPINN